MGEWVLEGPILGRSCSFLSSPRWRCPLESGPGTHKRKGPGALERLGSHRGKGMGWPGTSEMEDEGLVPSRAGQGTVASVLSPRWLPGMCEV